VAKCVDLTLAAEASTLGEVKRSLEDAIVGYVETVLDTDDTASIPRLLNRKGPLVDRLTWEILFRIHLLKRFSAYLADWPKKAIDDHILAPC
jgi:hypothetical protein